MVNSMQGVARRLVEPLRAWFIPWSFIEEGTFTPTFAGSTTPGTFTYSFQEGTWVRSGRVVDAWMRLVITAIPVAPTGSIVIDGLPFASASGTGIAPASATIGAIGNIDYRAGVVEITGRLNQGETLVRLFEAYDNAVAQLYPAASFTNTAAAITLSVRYLI